MLAPYSKIPLCRAQKKETEEEDIINSFYEERKSRSNNQKFHNLLKKNISFFQKENNHQEKIREQSLKNQKGSQKEFVPMYRRLSQPPLPQHPASSHSSTSLPKQSRSKSEYNIQIQGSSQSPIQIPAFNSTKNSEENLRELKSQLNRRININQYLTKLEEYDKENDTTYENKYKSENKGLAGVAQTNMILKCGHRYNPPEESLISHDNSDFLEDYSRISHKISRMSQGHLANQTLQMNQSRNDSRKEENIFEVTKNIKDSERSSRKKQTFGSAHSSRKQSLISEESPQSSRHRLLQNYDRISRQKNNCLTSQELSELHENSHPLRDSHSNLQKNSHSNLSKKMPYASQNSIDPEVQFNYKRRIKDLESELQQLKQKNRREDKFIQSIFKMRKVMLGEEQDCSLKELWRWIKQLPKK